MDISDVYGKRVELKYDYFTDGHTGPGPALNKELAPHIGDFKIPKGSTGRIGQGPYSGGIFDYKAEWPVQFDMFKEGVPGYSKDYAIGVPHELLAFVDKKE